MIFHPAMLVLPFVFGAPCCHAGHVQPTNRSALVRVSQHTASARVSAALTGTGTVGSSLQDVEDALPGSQWLFLVPLKGGIGGIVHPPIGRFFTTYIPRIVLAEPGGWKMLPIPPFRGTISTTIEVVRDDVQAI